MTAKRTNKLLIFLLGLTIVLTLLCTTAVASGKNNLTSSDPPITSYDLGDGTKLYYRYVEYFDWELYDYVRYVEIVGCDDAAKNVLIPATLPVDVKVETGGETVFVKTELPVEKLASDAFYKHPNLESIRFAADSHVRELEGGYWAADSGASGVFAFCPKLKTVVLPNSLEELGGYAFTECPCLKSMDLSGLSKLKVIRYSAFQNTPLQSVKLPTGGALDTIETAAFAGTKLVSVTIPDSVHSIGDFAFARCGDRYDINEDSQSVPSARSLKTVTLGKGVERIDEYAFLYADIESLVLPNSLTDIYGRAFACCTSLKSITWPNNADFTAVDGFADCTALPNGILQTIPESVTGLSPYAFTGCGFTSVTIPETIVEIGEGAFMGCKSLASLTVLPGVETIDALAFADCDALAGKTVDLPESVAWLGCEAFGGIDCGSFHPETADSYAPEHLNYVLDEDSTLAPLSIILRNRDLSLFCPYVYYSPFDYEYDYNDHYRVYCSSPARELGNPVTYTRPVQFYSYATRSDGSKSDIACLVETLNRTGAKITEPDYGPFFTLQPIDASANTNYVTVKNSYTENSGSGFYAAGDTVTIHAGTREGMVFDGWFSSDNVQFANASKETTTFVMPNTPVMVSAHWIVDPGVNPPSGNPFTDVNRSNWFYDDVMYAFENNLMAGTAADTFSPNMTTTRGMIVTILWRLEGEPSVNYTMTFQDVAANTWYTEAVRWAASTDVVSGYSPDRFGPKDNITREQLASILFRYAEQKRVDTAKKANLSVFPDGNKTSGWAKEAVQWAVAEGLISGAVENGRTYLRPLGNASRAEAAAILHRFVETIAQ